MPLTAEQRARLAEIRQTLGGEGAIEARVDVRPFQERARAQAFGASPAAPVVLGTMAQFIRLLGPTAGMRLGGVPGASAAGALSEAGAQLLEQPLGGAPQVDLSALSPGRIAAAGALPAGARLVGGVGQGVVGGLRKVGTLPNRFERARASTAPIPVGKLEQTTQEVADRFTGAPPRVVRESLERLTGPSAQRGPGGLTLPLRDVENLRQIATGRAPIPKAIGGAARQAEEAAARAGQPAAKDLMGAIDERRALEALKRLVNVKPSRLGLEALGSGAVPGAAGVAGIVTPELAALLAALQFGTARTVPFLRTVSGFPRSEALASGAANIGLSRALRER